MRLLIYQTGRDYKIYNNSKDNLLFVGHWYSTWKGGQQLELLDSSKNLILAVKHANKKLFQWDWSTKYILTSIQDNIQGEIYCKKYVKRHWQATVDNSIYDIYGHRGHLKSIFKDNKQVAIVNKEKFHFFESDTIYIDCNSDQDPIIICGIVLTFDMGQENGDSTMTIDFGNIVGTQERVFDDSWQPK